MARIQLPVWLASGMILVGAGLSLFTPTPGQTQAATQNVLVTNTTAQPVPVNINTAGNLVRLSTNGNIVKLDATTNTVKATQSGAWNVGLTATGNTVRVGNTKASPVPVFNARDATTPFQTIIYAAGSLTVPAGKRLVIEYAAVAAYSTAPAIAYQPVLSTNVGGTIVGHNLDLENLGTTGGYTFFQGGQATRIYADPNTTVSFGMLSYNGDPPNGNVTLSGYLLPYP